MEQVFFNHLMVFPLQIVIFFVTKIYFDYCCRLRLYVNGFIAISYQFFLRNNCFWWQFINTFYFNVHIFFNSWIMVWNFAKFIRVHRVEVYSNFGCKLLWKFFCAGRFFFVQIQMQKNFSASAIIFLTYFILTFLQSKTEIFPSKMFLKECTKNC